MTERCWNGSGMIPDKADGYGSSIGGDIYAQEGIAGMKRYQKPNVSYSTLIAQAISESPGNKLTLKEIYEWIMERYPFYRNQKGNWQNSIRHNLSLNKAFYRVPRASNSPGKGSFWCLDTKAFSSSLKMRNRRMRRSSNRTMQQTCPYQMDGNSMGGYIESMKDILYGYNINDGRYDYGAMSLGPITFEGNLKSDDFCPDRQRDSPQHGYNSDPFYEGAEIFKFP